MRLRSILTWIAALVVVSSCSYLTVPPIKLLRIESPAKSYNASESPYRTALKNGTDEKADITAVDELNHMPLEKLTLHPGGCANYTFPIQHDQKYMFMRPARKPGDVMPFDFCHKGKTVITAMNSGQASFNCFTDYSDCSPASCLNDIGSILDPSSKASQQVHIVVCNDPTSESDAAIWQLNFSSSNDTSKLQAVFTPEAKLRLGNTINDPVANNQLTMVSIVGDRGVGKSTVASLLSGNETLFKAGSSTTGTTTTGADISGVIPSVDYTNIMSQKLKQQISMPNQNLPIFLIDSEGMNVRGESFDFMTTSPTAVIGKVIVWIHAGSVQTDQILENLNRYMDGLDQIIFDDQNKQNTKTHCQTPRFGHIVIVINKMMGDKSDEQLFMEIMTEEGDSIPDFDKRNEIRHKLQQCFSKLSVHGLPVLSIKTGEGVTYDALDERYQNGLAKLTNSVLEASISPRIISVGSVSLVMNSTNADRIMATVIYEANKGKLDLTGFDAFWTSISFQVSIQLETVRSALTESSKNCELGGKVCSPCVCSYRNKVVQTTLETVNHTLANAVEQANTMFKIDDASWNAQQLIESDVIPWKLELTCKNESNFAFDHTKTGVCDSSIMRFSSNTSCNLVYICNTRNIAYFPSITLNADGIYFHDGALLDLLPPGKAPNGPNGASHGANGSNGEAGIKGTNLYINVKQLLKYSSDSMTVLARGGEGGNGGNGMVGAKGAHGVKGADGRAGKNGTQGVMGLNFTGYPTEWEGELNFYDSILKDAEGVKEHGIQIYSHEANCITTVNNKKCCGMAEEYQYIKELHHPGHPGGRGENGYDGTQGQDGGNGKNGHPGGNGGSGGRGGDGGDVTVSLKAITLNIQWIGGSGGQKGNGASGGQGGKGGAGGQGGSGGIGGPGGLGGIGVQQRKIWTSDWNMKRKEICAAYYGVVPYCRCYYDKWTHTYNIDSQIEHIDNPGDTGPPGTPGMNMPNGNNGNAGKPGSSGVAGQAGLAGTSKNFKVCGNF